MSHHLQLAREQGKLSNQTQNSIDPNKAVITQPVMSPELQCPRANERGRCKLSIQETNMKEGQYKKPRHQNGKKNFTPDKYGRSSCFYTTYMLTLGRTDHVSEVIWADKPV